MCTSLHITDATEGSCNPPLDLNLLVWRLKLLTEYGIFTYKKCRHSYGNVEVTLVSLPGNSIRDARDLDYHRI